MSKPVWRSDCGQVRPSVGSGAELPKTPMFRGLDSGRMLFVFFKRTVPAEPICRMREE